MAYVWAKNDPNFKQQQLKIKHGFYGKSVKSFMELIDGPVETTQIEKQILTKDGEIVTLKETRKTRKSPDTLAVLKVIRRLENKLKINVKDDNKKSNDNRLEIIVEKYSPNQLPEDNQNES